jgi:hypothetical protein
MKAGVAVFLLLAAPVAAQESKTAPVRRLYEKDRATAADGLRALLAFASDDAVPAGFDAVRQALEGRGLIEASWALKEGDLLTKGQLAYALCKALGIRGGLMTRVFGMSRRYALRECAHLSLMPAGIATDPVSGRELIDAIARAELHREAGSADSLRK